MNTSEAQTPVRTVLIAEDHELARYGLSLALDDHHGFTVVGEAENGEQAVAMAMTLQPDILLMDIGMPVKNGIVATEEIKARFPEMKIVMLTSHKDEEEVYASMAAGADAYCMKDIKIERLCQVLNMVMEGAIWLDPAIARLVAQALSGAESHPAKPSLTRKRYNVDLTDREKEVLGLIVAGKSNKEIARILDVTTHTAKAHVCNIIQKLAVDDRTQAAVKALQEGLLGPSAPTVG